MNSMTGMGRAQGLVQGIPIRIEIKSVNHRFCEVNCRLPSRFQSFEMLLQQQVKKKLARGKVDIFINEEKNTKLSTPEVDAYRLCFEHLQNICASLGLKDEVTLPDVLAGVGAWIQRDSDVELVGPQLQAILDLALVDLSTMRSREGAYLRDAILVLLTQIESLTARIAASKESMLSDLEMRLKERIKNRTQELLTLDPVRLHTEVLFYLDRSDITEELQRLESHFKQARQFMDGQEPAGRKLDFLLQEFNREYNTIGSKTQNTEVAYLVVAAKAELEKMREQIQNIE